MEAALRLVAQEARDDARLLEASKKSAADTFAEKTGATSGVGDDYQKWLKTSYTAKTRQAQSRYTDSDPTQDLKRQQDLINRMEEGSQYIASQSGRSQGAMDKAVMGGQYSQDDLLKASDAKRMAARELSDKGESRARGVSDKSEAQSQERKVRDTEDAIAQATITEKLEKRNLTETELAQLTDITTQKIVDFFKEEQTGAAQMDKASHIVENFWKTIGGGLLQAQSAVIQNPQLAGAAIGVTQNPFAFLGELIKGQMEASNKNADALNRLTGMISDLTK